MAMSTRKKRYLSEEEIERITNSLLTEGYDEDRIIDHLEHINEQRKVREENKPKHISSVLSRVLKKINPQQKE